MGYWLLLSLLLAGVLLLLLQRRRELAAGRRSAALPLRDRTLFNLEPGDIVQAEARDWAVEDRLLYDDDGFQWLEYLLRDGADHRWLVVCEDDWLEVDWLELVACKPPLPLPDRLDWQGQSYALQDQGLAWVSRRGAAMNSRLGACRYADYAGPDRRRLCVELWGGDPAVGRRTELSVRTGQRDRTGVDGHGSLGPAGAVGDAEGPGEIEVTAGRRLDPLSLTLLPGDGRPVYR